MNICFYTHVFPNPLVGGVERVTYNLTKYLSTQNIKVFSLTKYGSPHDGLIPSNLTDVQAANFVNDFCRKNEISILIDQYGSESYLRRPLIDDRIIILYCYHNNPFAGHIFRCLLQTFSFSNLKRSLLNIAFLLNTPRRRMKDDYLLRSMLNSGYVIFLSEYYLPKLRHRYNKYSDKLLTIPNFCEERLLNIIPKNKKNKLVWCGRIVHNPKNVFFLIKMWKALSVAFPEWEFVMVGDGEDRKQVERIIKKNKLDRIIITGFRDPYPIFSESKIFVFPSLSEGFGMVLLESMAHGCVPVVFDTSPAFHDIIQSGKNGYIVSDYSETEFIERCRDLMSDDDLLDRFSSEAKKIVDKFSIEKIGHQWIGLFGKLMKDNGLSAMLNMDNP